MIKQSFLRNYSLSKIYNQAEDEKNKLRVFYLRKVRKILKEKHEKERITQREKISEENREERAKRRLKNKMKTEFNESDTENNAFEAYGRSEIQNHIKINRKQKPDLILIDLKFQSEYDEASEFLLKNEKLKILKIKVGKNVLHSSKCSKDETRQAGTAFLRKNTNSRSVPPRDISQYPERHVNGCRNQSIIFHSEQQNTQKQKTKFLNSIKENAELKKIVAKLEAQCDQ